MANREFKIELDNVEMINGSNDLLKDTKVTKVTLTGENKLNSLNSTFENCTELTVIEGDVNLDGVSDMTEMTLNTPLDEIKVTNPTEENIQTDNSLNQVTNVKIGGTKYAKGGVQDVVGSLEWNAENFTYEDAILNNVYTNSSSIEESKNITVSNTLEQRATSIEITGQTYTNLVDGKATKNLLDEMSMQQTEGSPTQFAPHMEQPICLEYIEGQTYQNLVDGKGEETLISEYSLDINDFVPNTFEPPQNQLICLESMEGETYQNLIKGKGEYKLTDSYSATCTESNKGIDNPPNTIEIPEIWGNTVQGYVNVVSTKQIVDSVNSVAWSNDYGCNTDENYSYLQIKIWGVPQEEVLSSLNDNAFIQLKANTTYSMQQYDYTTKKKVNAYTPGVYSPTERIIAPFSTDGTILFTTDSTGKVFFYPNNSQAYKLIIRVVEGEVDLSQYNSDEMDLNYIQSVGDLYCDEEGSPILDEEGNEQYKLEIESSNNINLIDPNGWIPSGVDHIQIVKLEPNTKYIYYGNQSSNVGVWHSLIFCDIDGNESEVLFNAHCPANNVYKFTTGDYQYVKVGWGTSINNINTNFLPMLVRGSKVLPYIEGTGNNQSNKTTILMPQPLRRVGDFCDKLYYDYDSKKFFINSYDIRVTNDLTTEFNIYGKTFNIRSITEVGDYLRFGLYKMNHPYTNYNWSQIQIMCNAFMSKTGYNLINNIGLTANSIAIYYNPSHGYNLGFIFYVSKSEFTTYDEAGVEEWATKNKDLKIIYVYNPNPQIIETKILEKPSLETYSPKTYISTNTEIQPSQMSVTNKRNLYLPLSLKPSTNYTLQLDSVGKDDKPITVNLGGKEATIQPTNDTTKHHRVSISTPSELTTDNIELLGEGVIVNDVMLFEGNTSVIKQDVDYMDGIQSIGEPFESRNLFDYTQSEVGLLDHTNGNISEDNSWKYTTDFVSVKPNTTYCISQTSGSVFNYKIVEYNSSKAYLKGTNWTSSKGTDINRAYNTFTTSANTYYLRLGWQSSIFEIQLEEDTFPTEFMAFDTVRYKLEIQTYDSTWDKL